MEFKGLYRYLDDICSLLPDDLSEDFRKCYLNTLETTVRYGSDGSTFVITGDIEAMWLRDSSVQVSHYVRLAGKDEDCRELVKRLLHRQFDYICVDPYANAFNECANSKGHTDDITKQNPLVFERKYEIDSLIYPLWLLNKYYTYTGDAGIFDETFFKTYRVILDTLICEQDYAASSSYTFLRPRLPEDSLDNGGKGGDYAYTGMVRSAFRPSDDRCKYSFLVPSNMFIVSVLSGLKVNLEKAGVKDIYADTALKLISEVDSGIKKYGIIEHKKYGRIFAFEVDGLGNYNLMDDANVPSLLAAPYMDYCGKDDEIYLNTRRFILSKDNPYYFEGKAAKGIGSPHTPKNYIWHIGLIIEALTTDSKDDIDRIFTYLRSTTAGTGFMHEGFDCDEPERFTRSWFAWANTLFAVFILDCII